MSVIGVGRRAAPQRASRVKWVEDPQHAPLKIVVGKDKQRLDSIMAVSGILRKRSWHGGGDEPMTLALTIECARRPERRGRWVLAATARRGALGLAEPSSPSHPRRPHGSLA
jgi:hypothetical protein